LGFIELFADLIVGATIGRPYGCGANLPGKLKFDILEAGFAAQRHEKDIL
jgi:hypothetical protein